MNKNRLLALIAIVSLFTIFVSLISMMLLTPVTKKKSAHQTKDTTLKVSIEFTLKTSSDEDLNSQTP